MAIFRMAIALASPSPPPHDETAQSGIYREPKRTETDAKNFETNQVEKNRPMPMAIFRMAIF